MNNLVSALCGTVNFMPPWIMLIVFGAIILLIVLIIALKGVKRKFFRVLIYILAGLIPTAYLVYLIVQEVLILTSGGTEAILQLINFVISWGPTILLGIFVLIGLLRGMRRGLRKSLILALQAACAGAVCIAFFFTMVYVKDVDAGYLKFINSVMGGDGALQRMLGVPESCSTFKEVLAEYIPVLLGGDAGLGVLLKDNTAYLYTLVDLAYRVNFGIYAFFLFFSIDFILYIVYVFCYSEHKYKRIQKFKFINGKTDRDYKKHWLGGGVVGLVRGVATGLLCLSFVGSVFFIAAGGKGEGTLDEDYDFGDDEVNFYYQIYRSIESYGSQGIFKILNAMSDANDTPYYLFAADLMLSGELNDEELGISENIKFREELGAFTGFARDTLELLMKYGSDELNGIVSGEATENTFDTIVQVMTKPGFKEEFDSLIDAFDAQTYIINFSMSLVNSIVSNIDVLGNAIGEGERELIKLIFRKGFLSENIPDELALMEATGKTEAEGDDIRPYLTVNHLLTKKDVKLVLNLVLSVLAEEETGDTIQLVKRVTNELSRLSILSSERKAEFNPVLGRMYCLFENLYLTADGEKGVTYSEIVQDNIDWIDEINKLLDASSDVLVLYNNLSGGEGEGEEGEAGEEKSALDIVKSIFDNEETSTAYDRICKLITESRVLGRAFSTNFVYKTITEALKGVSENIYIPENLNFGNTYDENGDVVSYGETYHLLYGVKLLFSDDNSSVLETLLNMGEGTSMDEVLQSISEVVRTEEGELTPLARCLIDSVILRSVISINLIEVGGDTLYVPKAALEEVDGVRVNMITTHELEGLMANMDKLVAFVDPFCNDGDLAKTIDDFLLKDGDFYNLVQDNRIFEGTVARLLLDQLTDTGISVPKDLDGFENIDGWISVGGKKGELLNLLDALRDSEFSIAEVLLSGVSPETVLNKIAEMNEDRLNAFLSSRVLHYTVSGFILGGETVSDGLILVVPVNSLEKLNDGSNDSVIAKSEIIALFNGISYLGLGSGEGESGLDMATLLTKIVQNKSILETSNIIPASIVATLVNNGDIANDTLAIPKPFIDMGTVAELKRYDSNNPWRSELPALLDAIDELFGLSGDGEGEEFSFDSAAISNKISGLLASLNEESAVDPESTKLDVLYASEIFCNKMTVEIDEAFKDKVDATVIDYAKLNNGYYKKDELYHITNAVKALGISGMGDLTSFESYQEVLTTDNLNVVYKSIIAEGIISKVVGDLIAEQDADNIILIDHPYAHRAELSAVYKESEIYAVLTLFSDLDIAKIDYGKVGALIYDEHAEEGTDKVKSYILVASVSEQIIDHPGLIIPGSVVEEVEDKRYITALELSRMANAFSSMLGSIVDSDGNPIESIEQLTGDIELSVPQDYAVRQTVFASEIMRARITYQLIDLKGSGVLAVKEGNGKRIKDVREHNSVDDTATVTAEQLEAFANALLIISAEGATFEVPEITATKLMEICSNERLEEIFLSDIMRYRICEYLSGYPGVNMQTETAFTLDGLTVREVKTAEASDIKAIIDQLS